MGLFKKNKSTESDAILSVEEAQEKADRQKLANELSGIQTESERLAEEHKGDEEFQDLRKKAYEELTDATEPHTYLRTAQEFLNIKNITDYPETFDINYDYSEQRIRIKLAIGYATIGEIDEAIKLIDETFIGMRYSHYYSAYSYGDYRREALAEVAYYSGWITGISTKADVAKFATEQGNPTGQYAARHYTKYRDYPNPELENKRLDQDDDEDYQRIVQEYKERGQEIFRDEIEERHKGSYGSEQESYIHKMSYRARLFVDLLVDIAIEKYKESQKEV